MRTTVAMSIAGLGGAAAMMLAAVPAAAAPAYDYRAMACGEMQLAEEQAVQTAALLRELQKDLRDQVTGLTSPLAEVNRTEAGQLDVAIRSLDQVAFTWRDKHGRVCRPARATSPPRP